MSEIFKEIKNAFDYAIHFYDGVEYEKLTFGNDAFRIVLLFMWFGAIFAFIAMYYNNHYLGGFVEKLILSGATVKENAKTLEELGYSKKPFLKFSLRTGSVLRKCVLAKDDPIPVTSEFYKGIGTDADELTEKNNSEENRAEAEERSDADAVLSDAQTEAEDTEVSEKKQAREDINKIAFYIPTQLLKKAQTRYRKRGNSLFITIISIIVLGIIVFLAAVYGPLLLRFIDNALISMQGSENTYGR